MQIDNEVLAVLNEGGGAGVSFSFDIQSSMIDGYTVDATETDTTFEFNADETTLESYEDSATLANGGIFKIEKESVLTKLKEIINRNKYLRNTWTVIDEPYTGKIDYEFQGISGDINFVYSAGWIRKELTEEGIKLPNKVYVEFKLSGEVDGNYARVDVDWQNSPDKDLFADSHDDNIAHTDIVMVPTDIIFYPSEHCVYAYNQLDELDDGSESLNKSKYKFLDMPTRKDTIKNYLIRTFDPIEEYDPEGMRLYIFGTENDLDLLTGVSDSYYVYNMDNLENTKKFEQELSNFINEYIKTNSKIEKVKEISKEEWDKLPKDYKSIINGKTYMMYLDNDSHATVLGPCKIIDESLYDATLAKVKTLTKARNLIYEVVDTKGVYDDDHWEKVAKIINQIRDLGADVTYWPANDSRHSAGYSNDPSIPEKMYLMRIKFKNADDKEFVIDGSITCSGCGTVSDPLSKYDCTMILFTELLDIDENTITKVWYELYLPSDTEPDEKEFYEEYTSLVEARKAAKDAMEEFGYEKFFLYKMSPDWKRPQYCDTLTLSMFDESLTNDILLYFGDANYRVIPYQAIGDFRIFDCKTKEMIKDKNGKELSFKDQQKCKDYIETILTVKNETSTKTEFNIGDTVVRQNPETQQNMYGIVVDKEYRNGEEFLNVEYIWWTTHNGVYPASFFTKINSLKIGNIYKVGPVFVKLKEIQGNKALVTPLHQEDIDSGKFKEQELVSIADLHEESHYNESKDEAISTDTLDSLIKDALKDSTDYLLSETYGDFAYINELAESVGYKTYGGSEYKNTALVMNVKGMPNISNLEVMPDDDQYQFAIQQFADQLEEEFEDFTIRGRMGGYWGLANFEKNITISEDGYIGLIDAVKVLLNDPTFKYKESFDEANNENNIEEIKDIISECIYYDSNELVNNLNSDPNYIEVKPEYLAKMNELRDLIKAQEKAMQDPDYWNESKRKTEAKVPKAINTLVNTQLYLTINPELKDLVSKIQSDTYTLKDLDQIDKIVYYYVKQEFMDENEGSEVVRELKKLAKLIKIDLADVQIDKCYRLLDRLSAHYADSSDCPANDPIGYLTFNPGTEFVVISKDKGLRIAIFDEDKNRLIDYIVFSSDIKDCKVEQIDKLDYTKKRDKYIDAYYLGHTW